MRTQILRSLVNRLGNKAAKWAACLLMVACIGTSATAWGAETTTIKNAADEDITVYVVTDGFYQSGTTYNNSADFYITNLNGLKFFRDLVNGAEVASTNYVSSFVSVGNETGAAVASWHQENVFSAKKVHLLEDIDLNNEQWTPIGYSQGNATVLGTSVTKNTFYGIFDAGIYDDGQNLIGTHTVSNLYVYTDSTTTKGYIAGFFGRIQGSAAIKNLTIENVNIHAYDYIGAVVGQPGTGGNIIIENCHVNGTINISGYRFMGGIAGHGYCTITNCTMGGTGTVAASAQCVGAMIGYLGSGTIADCAVSNVTISTETFRIGAIAGDVGGGSTITGCVVSNATVTASNTSTAYSGVIAGYLNSAAMTVFADNEVYDTTATAGGSAITAQLGSANRADYAIIGTDITFDESGKVTGGIFENIPTSAIADGYLSVDNLDTKTNESYPFTIDGPFVAAIYDADGAFVGGYSTLKSALQAINDSAAGEYVVDVLTDVKEIIGEFGISEGHIVTVDSTAQGGVTIDFDGDCENWNSYFYPIDGTLTFGENVKVVNLTSAYSYPNGNLVFNGDATLSAFWTYYSTVTITESARVHMGLGDGVIQMAGGNLNVTGTLAAGEAATKTLAEVKNNQQLSGGYVQFRYGTPTLALKDTIFDTTWIKYEAGNGTGTFTLDLDNAAVYLNQSGFDLGEAPTGIVNLKNGSRLVVNGDTVKINASDAVNMDWKSSITARTFTNNGEVNIDATGITQPVKVIDYTGNGTMALADYGTVEVTSGEAYVEDNDLWVKKLPVAQIGDNKYETLADAVAAAQDGDTITMLADVTGETVMVTKNVTITGASNAGGNPAITLENTQLTLSGATVELAVTNLAFTGSSYINASNGKALTVDHVTAMVNPPILTGRSAFIVVSAQENTTGLDLAVTHSTIVNTFGTDSYGAAIFGWAYLNSATICDNVLGSDSYRFRFIAVKLMNAVDGATYTIERNTVYGTNAYYGFYGFDLYQNNSRNNNYTAVSKDNVFDVTATGSNDLFVFDIERNGNASTATIVIDSGSTLNGEAVTLDKFYNELNVNAGFYGAGVTFDNEGKMTGGTFTRAFSDEELDEFVAEELRSIAVGDGTFTLDLPVAQVGTTYYATLADAFNAANAAGEAVTITMIADSELVGNVGYKVNAGSNITLDLNGKTISQNAPKAEGSYLIQNNGTLTIKDSTDTNKNGTGTGKMLFYAEKPDTTASPTYPSNLINNFGILTVESGCLKNDTSSNGHAAYAIDNYSGGAVTISGGKIEALYTAVRLKCTSSATNNKLTQTGGEISGGNTGLWISVSNGAKAELNVTGGTMKGGTNAFYDYPYGGLANANYNIDGGTFIGDVFSLGANIDIADGTFNGMVFAVNDETISISGGTFSNAVPEEYCAEGFIPAEMDPKTGMYTVKEGTYVAQIDTTKYESLAEAFGDICGESGVTVKLLADTTFDDFSWLEADCTVDFDGHTLTFTDSAYLVIDETYEVVFKNGTIVSSRTTGGAVPISIAGVEDGEWDDELDEYISSGDYTQPRFVLNNMTVQSIITLFEVLDGGTMVVSNSTIETSGLYGIEVGGGTLVVDGGSVTGGDTGIFMEEKSSVTISAGSVTGGQNGIIIFGNGDSDEAPKLTIAGGTVTGTSWYGVSGNGTIEGGVDYSETVVSVSGGTVSGGIAGIYNPQKGIVTISGGTVTGVDAGVWAKSGNVAISDGAFMATGENGDALRIEAAGYPGGDPTATLTGGIFSTKPNDDYCASGYEAVANTDEETKTAYPWTVKLADVAITDADVVIDGDTATITTAGHTDGDKLWVKDGSGTWAADSSVTISSTTISGVPLPEAGAVKYYTVTKGGKESLTDETVEGNVIGALRVNSALTNTIIAVPWAKIGGGQVTVSNLVMTATLTAGDTLKAYDKTTGKFYLWELKDDMTWEANKTATTDNTETAEEADAYMIPRGAGVWLTRSEPTKPFYLIGEVATGDAVTALDTAAVENTDGKQAWNLVAPPTGEAFDLNGENGIGAQRGGFDRIVVPTATVPYNYTYKDGKWGYYEFTKDEDGIAHSTFVTEGATVPAGTGFWYLNSSSSEESKIEWNK